MLKNTGSILLFFAICGLAIINHQDCPAATGQQVQGSTTLNIHKPVIISGRLGVGYLTGQSYENVYDTDTGRKVSELDWDLSSVFMLNGGVSVQPFSWLKLNGDVWVKINDGSGDMVDYDWLVEGLDDWTHRSYSTDVDLNTGYMIDVNAEFPVLNLQGTNISGFVGYKYDNWEWEARGGTYIYSTYYLRDTIGSFPENEKGITYEQWFHVPYIGIGFNTELTRAFLSGRIIFSPFVQAGDEDHHHMRNLLFEEDFDNGTMIGIDFSGGYHITEQFSLLGSYHYQKYNEVKGDTTITDLTTGRQLAYIPGDAAGAEHYSHLFSITAMYSF